MKIENLCINCMKEKASPEGRCEHCGYDPAEDTIPPHHLAPFVILEGKYLVGKAIGEGGFGITYIGMDLNLEMRVAIKEYYPNGCAIRDTSNNSYTVQSYSGEAQTFFETGREKFINEAKILAKCIELPEIVTVKDFFKENHTAYIVMEYLDGETLKAYLKERGGRISVSKTLEMMRPLIRSLGQVHKMNLIHRDISPDNIMLTKDGSVKILDFGGARDFVSSGGKSLSIMLKPGYAPEEQYRTHGEQGPWTDVYALCATMYRCITGQIPPESMERTYQDQLRPISYFQPDCPPQVEYAIRKGLAVYKNERLQSMEELYDCLYNGQKSVRTENRQKTVPHGNTGNVGNNTSREKGKAQGGQYYPPAASESKVLPIMVGVLGVVLLALLAVFGLKYYKANYETTTDSTKTTKQLDSNETSDESSSAKESNSAKESKTEESDENKEKDKSDKKTVQETPTPIPTPTEVPKVATIDMPYIDTEVFGAKGSGAQESLYVWNCRDGHGRGTDLSRTSMSATGMVTVPILYTVAAKIEAGEISLDTPVTFSYTSDLYAGGRGNLSSGQNGQQLSIDTLLQSMLMYSDNNATNSMIDFLTMEGIQQTCQAHGFDSVIMRRKLMASGEDNMISAKDATKMIQEIYDNQFSAINRDYLINYMKIRDDAVRHAIFKSDTLYNGGNFCNQNGINNGTYAEVGIVFADGKEYIVCVMAASGNKDLEATELSDAVQYVHSCL